MLHGALLFCAVVVAALVYRYDLYDREPWPMMLLAAALGAGAMWTMEPLGVFTIELMGGYSALGMALVAGVQEELGKFAAVLVIALVFRRVFNDPMDGLIYGSLAGLGAAVEESIGVLRGVEPGALLPGAEIVRLVGHAIMGGIAGYGVGMWVIRHRRRRLVLVACLLAAMLLHFLWDVVAMTQTRAGSLHSLAGVAIMLTGLLIYGRLVIEGSAHSRTHFQSGDHRRLFGWPFVSPRRATENHGGEIEKPRIETMNPDR